MQIYLQFANKLNQSTSQVQYRYAHGLRLIASLFIRFVAIFRQYIWYFHFFLVLLRCILNLYAI